MIRLASRRQRNTAGETKKHSFKEYPKETERDSTMTQKNDEIGMKS